MAANWLRRYRNKIPHSLLIKIGNLYPPFWGAGIQVDELKEDATEIRVSLPLRWYNRNYVGTQFGGSIYAMTDPFYMLLYMTQLGSNYIVWDKSACIDFIKPGKSTLRAKFTVSPAEVADLKQRLEEEEKLIIEKTVLVHDDSGVLVAEVRKKLYFRKKQ